MVQERGKFAFIFHNNNRCCREDEANCTFTNPSGKLIYLSP